MNKTKPLVCIIPFVDVTAPDPWGPVEPVAQLLGAVTISDFSAMHLNLGI